MLAFVLWLAAAALLLGGWFYNMGKYRQKTKYAIVIIGIGILIFLISERL